MEAWITLGIVFGLAFVPALLVLLWIRNHERHGREPFRIVLSTFIFGATVGVALAVLLSLLFDLGYPRLDDALGVDKEFFAIVLVAPFAEELAKGFGLAFPRKRMPEVEDGIIYGVAIGLGFGATENLVYALEALARGGSEGGLDLAIQTIIARVFSSMLLHATASGILGYGYALVRKREGVSLEVFPYYLGAVLLHSVYNFIVALQAWIGFLVAVTLVAVSFGILRQRVKALDALPHGP